ncbi:MAG TPA: DUF2937 family protein [Lacunisphaera sp.]|jgi:hypothetical protein|nr:DUF2937 family protein [Lacunisphaera sp.]
MNPGRALLGAGDGLLDRVLCAAGAVLFSQLPEFMQQYLQRLGGHLDEARRNLRQFEDTAGQAGLTLDRFVAQTAANHDPAVAKLSGVMTQAAARVDELAAAQAALTRAAVWERPFVFVRHVDTDIAAATWHVFKPAVPTTPEGLVYALTGMLVLLALYHLAFKPTVIRVCRRRPRSAAATA